MLTSEEARPTKAIEEAKVSAKKAEKGEWEVPRTEEEEAHISEFMSILRMRQIDVGSAVDRASRPGGFGRAACCRWTPPDAAAEA